MHQNVVAGLVGLAVEVAGDDQVRFFRVRLLDEADDCLRLVRARSGELFLRFEMRADQDDRTGQRNVLEFQNGEDLRERWWTSSEIERGRT